MEDLSRSSHESPSLLRGDCQRLHGETERVSWLDADVRHFREAGSNDVQAIQPRFEFRTWGGQLDAVRDRIASLVDPYELRESVETYIVSAAATDANPKVRGDRLDIKVLIATRDGFEQWEPQLKASFPISASILRNEFFRILGEFAPNLDRDDYTYEQFIQDIVERHDELAAVEVLKQRRISTVSGCITEFAHVSIAGEDTQTAAVESTDLAALHEARRLTGLDAYENINYPRAIKRAIGWDAA